MTALNSAKARNSSADAEASASNFGNVAVTSALSVIASTQLKNKQQNETMFTNHDKVRQTLTDCWSVLDVFISRMIVFFLRHSFRFPVLSPFLSHNSHKLSACRRDIFVSALLCTVRLCGAMSIKVSGDARICTVMESTMAECKPGCTRPLDAYSECVTRLGPEPAKGTDCQLQYFDYYRCLDQCVRACCSPWTPITPLFSVPPIYFYLFVLISARRGTSETLAPFLWLVSLVVGVPAKN